MHVYGNEANLLETNVHVKRQWLPWVADGRDAELPIGWCNAGDHLNRVGARVVSHLQDTCKQDKASLVEVNANKEYLHLQKYIYCTLIWTLYSDSVIFMIFKQMESTNNL